MTAFLVADLIAAGTWKLDDPIEKHWPPDTRVPGQGNCKIRVRDLLTHGSALPRLQRNLIPRTASDLCSDMTEQDLLSGLAAARLQGTIGGQAVYSNLGVMLLSVAVVRSYQADFDVDFKRVLTDRLPKPLKVDRAFVARQPADVRLAPGHLWTGEITPHWTCWAATPNAAGVGGVRARLDDMVRGAEAKLGLVATPLAARLRSLMDGNLPVPTPRRAVAMPESLRKMRVGEFTLDGLDMLVRDEGGSRTAPSTGSHGGRGEARWKRYARAPISR